MKILFLCHRVPYPPDKGERIRAFHQLRHLSNYHTVDLACPVFSDAEVRAASELTGRHARTVFTGTISRLGRAASMGLCMVSAAPISVGAFACASLKHRVADALRRERYDAIFVYCSSMFQYLPSDLSVPVVTDFVDADSAKWKQYASKSNALFRWIYRREGRLLADYERMIASRSSSVVAVSEKELGLIQTGTTPAYAIANGAEVEELPPTPESADIVFVGQMDYRPNVDAVQYFVDQIFPRVKSEDPSARFTIVGRNPAASVKALQTADIEVTGEVASVAPYLRSAKVAVAPFRISQGVHNKILEALSVGVPVVSTSAAATGVEPVIRRFLVTADDPTAFADAIIRLRRNGWQLPDADRKRLSDSLGWEDKVRKIEELLLEAASGGSNVALKATENVSRS